MKQSRLKSVAYRNAISMILITFVVALIALTMTTSGAAFSNPDAKLLEPQITAQESKPSDVRELKLGVPIERELKGSEGHSYTVTLTSGQYLHVVIEQKGIDVVVRLFGPDGQKITEVDSPNGTQGPEPVSLIAPAPGNYRLEVVSPDKAVAPGRYEIRVKEFRKATVRDRTGVAAAGILLEGNRLRDQGTADSLRKALEKYSQTLPLWREVEDRQEEASALSEIGSVYWQLGENQKSIDYHNQALLLWRLLGDRKGEGNTLNNIGVGYWQLGDSYKALEYYSQALRLEREVGDRQAEASTLIGIGLAYNHLGSQQEALDYQNQALALARATGNRPAEAMAFTNMGVAYYGLGNLQKALDCYNHALTLQRALGSTRNEALLLSNIGVIYWQLGENQKALEYYNQALPLRRATGDRNGEAFTLQNIGKSYESLGDLKKALEYYRQALALGRATGDRWGESATLQNISLVYRSLGDSQKALDSLNQALLLRRAVGDRLGEAITLSQIGRSYASMGKPEEALNYLDQALALHRIVGDRINEAATLGSIALAERARGRLDEARARIEAAINIVESTRSKFASQQLRTSFSASRQGFHEVYVDLLMQMHRDRPSAGHDAEALQASERGRARSLLDILTESRADIRQGVDPVLLERERSLQQQLNAKSERLTRLLGGKHTEGQETAARKEVEALLTDYHDVQAQIRSKSPRYAALTQPQPISLKEIQQLLDKETLLLEYALGEEHSYLWAVTPTLIKSFELPKRTEVETAARRVYDLFTARNQIVKFEEVSERKARVARADAEYPRAAGALSQMLLGPVANQIRSKRLLIVSDGVLQYLPFAALPLPNSSGQRSQDLRYVPLISRHEVVNLPSASTLAVLRKELSGRKLAPRAVAVLADAVFDSNDERVKAIGSNIGTRRHAPSGNGKQAEGATIESELTRSVRDLISNDEEAHFPLPRLPFTRREADAVVAFAPAKQYEKALDFAASRATALDPALGQYRYVHFATHVILNTKHPELSGIVLSLINREGNDQNGFLLAHEIYNLNLPAELVVLSGCRTGLGKEIRGEGLVSLTRGFVYAGAERVLVSLWDVNDESTAELMTHFYKGMLTRQRLKPPAALRQAQLAMWKSARWQAPYYWGAFVLHGEYR